ncbi:uncharacterized protein FIBRA_08863 [Fibroporia radiculosa]|uniref:F-box domain-containing protein n=1 Tax=Fibroporia radiculosa TaxID=599839 RepID=J4GXJ0_9APHY|nr:uncharacterized protein FIBRA_08863 [Fibroporia radiculosa]CCM06585.1 predicted protein [Fibroporia radiculosa]
MDVAIAYSPEDLHSVAERDELEDIATVGAEQNVQRSCWDVSITERMVSQLWDICPLVSRQLPIELWEHIIDFFADDDYGDRDDYDMRQLGQVCRGWYARCRFHHYERLYMWYMDRREVYRLINSLVEHPDRCSAIKTVWIGIEDQSIGPFGSFAVRMVQKLPRVEFLRLWCWNWESGQLHAQAFLHITLTFGSVTRLQLFEVIFPSAVVFGRLMRALPRLSFLECIGVQFKHGCHVTGAVRVPGTLRLDAADLDHSDDVFDFLASIGAHIRHLTCYGTDWKKLPELFAVTAESLLSLQVGYSSDAPSIDLTPTVNLRVLVLDGYLKDIPQAAGFLSRTSLPNLVELTIKSWATLFKDGTLDIVQDELNSIDNDSFAQMDRVLSSRQFPALRKVTFLFHCDLERSDVLNVISEGTWRTLLSSRLPALDASGRLLTPVMVEIYQL